MEKSLNDAGSWFQSAYKWLNENVTGHLIFSVIIVILVIILIIILKKILKKIKKAQIERNRDSDSDTKTLDSIYKIIFDVASAILIVAGLLSILQINGINVTSIITGLGIAGAVLGLAVQDPLKDLISGIQIVTDKFYTIGTAVKYNDFEGTINGFTLRTTKIIDYDGSTVMTVSNRNISQIIRIPDPMYQYIDIPLSYDDDPEKIHKDMLEIIEKVKEDEKISDCIYKYTNAFKDSSIEYTIRISNKPADKNTARRNAITIVQRELNKRNYVIPYNQLDIHTK